MMFFIITKKSIFNVFTVVFAILILWAISTEAVKMYKSDVPRVIIDAGHGEPDGGCVGNLGSVEQEINLSVAKKVAEILEAKRIDTRLTRENSLGLWSEKSKTIREKKVEDMKKRMEIMNRSDADLFISIHMNSYPTKSANGLRVFYDKNHPEIKELAENIQARMSDITDAKSSAIKPADRNLFLFKDTPIPVILIECGFLSNPDEEKKLMDSEYRAKLAWAIADAIEKYYLKYKIN